MKDFKLFPSGQNLLQFHRYGSKQDVAVSPSLLQNECRDLGCNKRVIGDYQFYVQTDGIVSQGSDFDSLEVLTNIDWRSKKDNLFLCSDGLDVRVFILMFGLRLWEKSRWSLVVIDPRVTAREATVVLLQSHALSTHTHTHTHAKIDKWSGVFRDLSQVG